MKRDAHKIRRRPWTTADIRLLRELYPDRRAADVARTLGRTLTAVYARARELGLAKSEAFKADPASGRNVKGHAPHGQATRFRKGMTPWNKGRSYAAGGRSAETRFKPGQVSKRWDPEIYCIGALRINADGYIDMKIREGSRSWRSLHLMLWEDAHGPIPAGYALRFIDGDKMNVCLENLQIISRANLMRRNTIHNLPEPLKDTIRVLGTLKRKLREKQDRRSA